MEGVWRGVFNILLAVSWASTESDIQENIPLQTLNCNNDFRTRIICQWEEVADAQHYLNLTLFRQKYDNEPSKPVFCDSEQNTSLPTCQFQSCIPRTCFIHQDVFVTSQVDIFSFKSDQPLELQLSINLTQNVLPPAPENLKIVKNETKGFLLSWVMPRSWSKSPQSSLVGLTFQVAYKRQWESWEVASTMDSSMSRVPLGYDSLIPDNLYVARVRAKTSRGHTSLWSSEVLWESQKVKPRTPSIKVKKAGNNYWLQWEKPEVPFVSGQTYEVQYRKSTQSWEEAHREILTIILDMNISETSLEPATEYFARVRAMVTDSSYGGTWSEWSNVCSWRTEKVFPPEILGLVLVITTILVLLGTWCCYTFGARLRTNWENKIPNPSKSRLFQNKNQRIWNPGNVFPLSQESPWEKEEREYSVSSVNWLDSEDRSSVSPLTAVDPQDACSLSSDPDPYPASITLPDEDLSLACSQKMPQTSTPVKDLASGFAFNGPYLRLPQSHSLPNISGQMGSCQAEENKKHPCGSLEYFCLPQGGQGGLVPMTKLVEPGRDRVEKETSSDHPSSREEAEPRPLKEQATPLSGEPREEKNLSQVATSSTSPLKLTGVSGYIAPEDLVLGSEKAESLPLLTMPSSPCPAPESSLSLCLGETKGPLSAPSPAMLALEGYVEVPLNMVSAEAPPENPSPLQVGPSAPNPMDAQQDETITVFHPEGLIVLQQIGDYCFFPSQSQLVSPGHCPEKMAKPQDIQGKEPPGQPLPQVPAIQLFKAMKHQEYLVLPTWDGCRPGQVC
ncbi:cytokine receptor common subunit beta isoform X2 [Phascolarctos cinereus]|uniref:Cytokine receptor common subunit beta isoform X2 n=1 Tax=Phascolarctos cinereus TaxID=38626 RepID=A0A6P5JZD6_PHACI|nr:cytokine receptor common subunit beta isoform X2 [Phascolarctos cinereus]